jgi:hypothetical protein
MVSSHPLNGIRNYLQSVVSRQPPSTTDDDDNKIDSPSLVYKLLRRAFEQHCLLDLSFNDLTGAYGSVIVQLEDSDDSVVLDELTPRDTMAGLRPGCQVSVATLVNGLQLTFTTTLRGIH